MEPSPAKSRRYYEDRMDPAMIPVLRAKSPEERLAISNSLWRSARIMLTHLIAADHPDWPPEQVAREVASRLSHGTV